MGLKNLPKTKLTVCHRLLVNTSKQRNFSQSGHTLIASKASHSFVASRWRARPGRTVERRRCSSFCPDETSATRIGKTIKIFGYSLRVYFILGKILTLIGQIFMILDKFSLLLMAQYWKDNWAIWPHWLVQRWRVVAFDTVARILDISCRMCLLLIEVKNWN